jgi:hypothetical protein
MASAWASTAWSSYRRAAARPVPAPREQPAAPDARCLRSPQHLPAACAVSMGWYQGPYDLLCLVLLHSPKQPSWAVRCADVLQREAGRPARRPLRPASLTRDGGPRAGLLDRADDRAAVRPAGLQRQRQVQLPAVPGGAGGARPRFAPALLRSAAARRSRPRFSVLSPRIAVDRSLKVLLKRPVAAAPAAECVDTACRACRRA